MHLRKRVSESVSPAPKVRTRPKHLQSFCVHYINRPSVRCGPSKLGWAAIYVQDFDAPCVLQFAWISALCCALHRSTSLVIHRSGSYLFVCFTSVFDEDFPLVREKKCDEK